MIRPEIHCRDCEPATKPRRNGILDETEDFDTPEECEAWLKWRNHDQLL